MSLSVCWALSATLWLQHCGHPPKNYVPNNFPTSGSWLTNVIKPQGLPSCLAPCPRCSCPGCSFQRPSSRPPELPPSWASLGKVLSAISSTQCGQGQSYTSHSGAWWQKAQTLSCVVSTFQSGTKLTQEGHLLATLPSSHQPRLAKGASHTMLGWMKPLPVWCMPPMHVIVKNSCAPTKPTAWPMASCRQVASSQEGSCAAGVFLTLGDVSGVAACTIGGPWTAADRWQHQYKVWMQVSFSPGVVNGIIGVI